MSFKVAVVCEDHTLDQYVVVPIIRAVLSAAGKPQAVVRVVTSPQLRGISNVETEFEAIATRYSAINDMVIFALDRDALDGQGGRGDRAASFSAKVASLEPAIRSKVEVVLAVEETEVWALWGVRSDIKDSWAVVRGERDSKERYFDPFVTRGDMRQPGQGRTRLVSMSIDQGWSSLSTGCPELADLKTRVASRAA
ncbi:hypothetical protein [Curtobacterium sp. PhB25]|uniref:hypothetical protein n=1 Tax=Curtobacterium sp. PhB25 TaxID=2485205 RepID=UPI001066856E|nr:hypothetical protein [Curtobacterium sp. PhB25]